MDDLMVIGIDHGWSHMKTKNHCFVSGISEIESEPIVYEHVLEYNGKFYRIGGERLKVQEDKVSNENYYLLTLPAIGLEMKSRGVNTAHVALAVGLPIGRFGAEKRNFINYLSKNKMVKFRYEKKKYTVFIERVLVYPQCYGAIVSKL